MTLKIELISDAFDRNQNEEHVQKTAWKLVRSAADRFGDGKGEKKLAWCVSQIRKDFKFDDAEGIEKAEDYIRSAYINYKIERG